MLPMTEHKHSSEMGEGDEFDIAHALMRRMGWGSREPPEPADEVGGA